MIYPGIQLLAERLALPPLVRGVVTKLLEEVQRSRRAEAEHQEELRRLREQLQQAADLQRELLPTNPPEIERLTVHTLFRPADTVSGDLYDIVRLDERRVAFTLADATGQGLPAGMLSAMTRRSLSRRSAGVTPDRMLARANREILALSLSECQFVGALYAVYDECQCTVTWARGGVPYPILVHPGQTPRQVPTAGPALGAVEDAAFECVCVRLEPGDRLLFHTDGVDALLLEGNGRSVAGDLRNTDWFTQLPQDSLDLRLANLDDRLALARSTRRALDDLTVVALEARAA